MTPVLDIGGSGSSFEKMFIKFLKNFSLAKVKLFNSVEFLVTILAYVFFFKQDLVYSHQSPVEE